MVVHRCTVHRFGTIWVTEGPPNYTTAAAEDPDSGVSDVKSAETISHSVITIANGNVKLLSQQCDFPVKVFFLGSVLNRRFALPLQNSRLRVVAV